MNPKAMNNLMREIFDDCVKTHHSGQKEYANDKTNVFANFERIADRLDLSKQEVLVVYLLKHIDGIVSHVKGHKSQRENVRGRIKDAIVYLSILWGMEDVEDNNPDDVLYTSDSSSTFTFTENPDE